MDLARPRSRDTDPRRNPRTPWKLALTALVPGLAFGLQQNLFGRAYYSAFTWMVFGVGGFAVAAVIFLMCALKLRMNFNRMIYHYSYTAMALGCVLGVLGGAAGDAGYGLFAMGYRLFDILLWSLGALLIHTHDLEPDWFAGICVGSSLLGRFAGFSPIPSLLGLLDPATVPFTLALLAFALLATALFMENRNNTFEAWGLKRPDGEALDNRDVQLTCKLLAGQWELTPRERQILELVARGDARRDIAEEPGISEETVKTHLSRIFQKSGHHTRAELEEQVKNQILARRGDPL